MLKMKKEHWQVLVGSLGCFGATVLIILAMVVVCFISALLVSVILSIFKIEHTLDTVYGLMTVLVPIGLLALHIYRGYKNGFYSK
ncbi:hypothetical protein ACIQ34_07180 [Ureibacillus sp. NPDC094379]